jgi:DNA-directed RNA polymerase subunit beta
VTKLAEPTKNGSVVSFEKLSSPMATPHFLDVQIQAFERLLEPDSETDRRDVGLDRVFKEIFPIEDVNGNFSLEFQDYSLGEPKYSVDECMERDMTYAAPLKATLRLIVWEELEEGERRPGDIIEKEVYLGDLPLLTELGTFIINGAERVVVSQLHRSPGVIFEENIHPNGTRLHSARIIPFRGSWVEFTIDINNICYVHIDKKKKFPATALLRAFGYGTDAEIYQLFFDVVEVELPKTEKDGRLEFLGAVLASDIVDPETGEILLEGGSELDEEALGLLERAEITKIQTYGKDGGQAARGESPIVKNTLKKDPTSDEAEALSAIYSLLRPGEPPNIDTARTALERVFFNPKRYDLGRVGRYKINQRLHLDLPRSTAVLTREDFIAILRYLIDLSGGAGYTDDIDHLGNRRVRTVGELIANQFSVGLSRMARLVKERMSINTDPEKINIDDLVNARTVSAVIQAFFGSSQRSRPRRADTGEGGF